MSHVPIAIPAACCLAMAAFSVAVLSGVGTENDLSSILERALFALLFAWAIGFAVGRLLERLFAERSTWNQNEDNAEGLVTTEDARVSGAAIPVENGPSSTEVGDGAAGPN